VKLGIIGKGFVGSAVEYGFSNNFDHDIEIKIYDKDEKKSSHTLSDVVNNSKFIFISLPTPSFEDGSINLNILDNALLEISQISSNDDAIFLVRSTIIPGSTRMFQSKYPNINLVFNPEFLTERNANFDFVNQDRFIIGGEKVHTAQVASLYKLRFGSKVPIIETNFETAELIKYMNNSFLATKVSFLNEMKILGDQCGVDWEKAVKGFSLDSRIGNSHLDVPGHDGKYGFGGSCFPKDIQAIINFGDTIGVNMNVLKGALDTNLLVRPERDWEKLEGRAITKDKKG
jgi:nucleotide sugar dehydrogenase